jgi:uncharacterized membrane protein
MFSKFQTYYLLLAAVCLLMMYLFPIAQIQIENSIYDLNTNGIKVQIQDVAVESNLYTIQILLPLTAFFLLSAAFIFKKTHQQKTIGRLSYILIFLILFFCWFELYQITNIFKNYEILKGYRGFYFLIASLTFVFLANRTIKREEEILKIFDQIKKK